MYYLKFYLKCNLNLHVFFEDVNEFRPDLKLNRNYTFSFWVQITKGHKNILRFEYEELGWQDFIELEDQKIKIQIYSPYDGNFQKLESESLDNNGYYSIHVRISKFCFKIIVFA